LPVTSVNVQKSAAHVPALVWVVLLKSSPLNASPNTPVAEPVAVCAAPS